MDGGAGDIPVFNTVTEAVEATGADVCVVFVRPAALREVGRSRVDRCRGAAVLVITEGIPVHDNELGHIPLERETASLFVRLISSRAERAPLIVTSHKPIGRWGEIFGDDVVAAMIDSLVHHARPRAAALVDLQSQLPLVAACAHRHTPRPPRAATRQRARASPGSVFSPVDHCNHTCGITPRVRGGPARSAVAMTGPLGDTSAGTESGHGSSNEGWVGVPPLVAGTAPGVLGVVSRTWAGLRPVMSIKRMHAGDSYQYLLRSVVDAEGGRRVRPAGSPMTRYYTETGTPPGQ